MKKTTLEIILDKACFFGLRGFELSGLSDVLPALPNGKTGLLIEFENKALFERNSFGKTESLEDFANGWKIIRRTENFKCPAETEKLVNFYANISGLKRKFSRLAVLLPPEKSEFTESLEKSCIAVFEKKDLSETRLEDLLKLKIAQINIQKTPLFLMAKYAWIFVLLFCAFPFFIPSNPAEQVSNLRNINNDVQKYSEKSDIIHVLKDGESLTQIARFAIGKYNSFVSTENMVKEYLKDNGLSVNSKINAGDTIKLKLPAFSNPQHKTLQPAWSFFTGLLNDSLSYITELYNPLGTATKRRHDGIDIGARKGTRILSPFSGTAWTMEDERGGLMIAVARENDILVFMHCEQRFYLNGQTVMQGDPIASVGTSGHTTGPHVHVVAGKITKTGEKRVGDVRYNVLNPFEWYSSVASFEIF
jgi:murein DD-endopeptidase MepM/ murein hydrolase activator NlpD